MRQEIERRRYYGEEMISKPRVQIHQLRALVAQMAKSGDIHPRYQIMEYEGWVHAHVLRLRPRPKRWPRVLLWVVMALAFLAGVGYLTWHSRYVLGMSLGLLAGAWLLLKSLAGHSAGCTGIHCSGCRG
jgi:hypothetical protein